MAIIFQKVNSLVTFTVNSALLAFNGEWLFLFLLLLPFEKEWADDKIKKSKLLFGLRLSPQVFLEAE